ncbi:MAG: ParB/RepB/Spo0J family partition protein [Firmicutes bacterium]|nr:ParB/RepB/Spo0J family partition protein [Bacillota bacterium]
MPAKKGLGSKGKGMEALFSKKLDSINEGSAQKVLNIDMEKIQPNPNQPRKRFREKSLKELSESIKNVGVLQPILLRKSDDVYYIIAGERRFRAAKLAGLTEIPAVVKEGDDSEIFLMALVENIQRENLNPIEEAESLKRLMDEFHLSQEETASRIGKSRAAVANSVRLLNLDPRVKNFLSENKISGGHGKALLGVSDKNLQYKLCVKIINEDLSVRAAEDLVKRYTEKKKPAEKKVNSPFADFENTMSDALNTKVKIVAGKRKGKIEIEYTNEGDLLRLIERISNPRKK